MALWQGFTIKSIQYLHTFRICSLFSALERTISRIQFQIFAPHITNIFSYRKHLVMRPCRVKKILQSHSLIFVIRPCIPFKRPSGGLITEQVWAYKCYKATPPFHYLATWLPYNGSIPFEKGYCLVLDARPWSYDRVLRQRAYSICILLKSVYYFRY